jgi:hypothetical protein
VTSHEKFVVADAEGRVHGVTPSHRVTLVWAWGPRAAKHFDASPPAAEIKSQSTKAEIRLKL